MKREKGVSVSGNRGKESIEGIRCITHVYKDRVCLLTLESIAIEVGCIA